MECLLPSPGLLSQGGHQPLQSSFSCLKQFVSCSWGWAIFRAFSLGFKKPEAIWGCCSRDLRGWQQPLHLLGSCWGLQDPIALLFPFFQGWVIHYLFAVAVCSGKVARAVCASHQGDMILTHVCTRVCYSMGHQREITPCAGSPDALFKDFSSKVWDVNSGTWGVVCTSGRNKNLFLL